MLKSRLVRNTIIEISKKRKPTLASAVIPNIEMLIKFSNIGFMFIFLYPYFSKACRGLALLYILYHKTRTMYTVNFVVELVFVKLLRAYLQFVMKGMLASSEA